MTFERPPQGPKGASGEHAAAAVPNGVSHAAFVAPVPSVHRVMNFSAGPAALPEDALRRAQAELLDFDGTGMSVMEQSHRGKEYDRVHHEAISLLRRLASIPDDYAVLFLQGGASMQFASVPLNFLESGQSADYVLSGYWGEKALSEAKVVASQQSARVRVAGKSGVADAAGGAGAKTSYARVPRPEEVEVDPSAAYVHVTSNETIDGVQFEVGADAPLPDAKGRPLVCDASSDFLWKPFDVRRFALMYAGAQKNVGPSGLCIVVARKDFLDAGRKGLPKILQYRTHAESDSLYNTPPTFAIYLVRNVLAWLEARGGLTAIEAENRTKAERLYGAIAAHDGFYRCPVEPASRSVMNVVWRLPTPELDAAFVAEAKAAGMVGLKGHRVVGGIRASIYNAVPLAWVDALVDFMNDFAKRRG
jgi:phosphoserine aminotransferase